MTQIEAADAKAGGGGVMGKVLFWYWFFICILGGLADGHWQSKCPNDPHITARDMLEFLAFSPAIIGFTITAPRPPYPCKNP